LYIYSKFSLINTNKSGFTPEGAKMKKPITKFDVYQYFSDQGRYGCNLMVGSYRSLDEAKARCERGASKYFTYHIVKRLSNLPSLRNMDDIRYKHDYQVIY